MSSRAVPTPFAVSYPPELPVSQLRDEIARIIRDNQVVIVAGETGSGKTTQLPKICLELGRTSIGHTQPRRIAARTIAERIAEELGDEVGGLVGYQVRFTDQVGANTRIKLMTDGILLNEMHRDRMLTGYDTIIIDEAHERSLNIDFLLGYLKQLLPKRPELKVIVTSATIDPESFATHFAAADGTPAPIVEVSGRTFPVEIRYRPLVPDDPTDDPDDDDTGRPSRRSQAASSGTVAREERAPNAGRVAREERARVSRPPRPDRSGERGLDTGLDTLAGARYSTTGGGARYSTNEGVRAHDYLTGITDALDELARESSGDVLVFLSGQNEIRDAEEAIRGHLATTRAADTTEVLPLYGRLSAADQHRVFQPAASAGIRRRIVLATNVAETSLTVPGIRYVIDAGTARISRYSVRAKVQRLPIEAISQASASQRSGRSGRTSDGIAIRLYSQEDFERRPEFTEPEVLRTNLAAVILQMISLDLGDIAAFPFLTPPDARGIKDGLDLLAELGALESVAGRVASSPRLTRIGRDLAKLPIDPRFGRMVIESKRHSTSREVMAIVAGLTIQDPRERPLERRAQADQQHARFADPTSDFLTLLNLWNYLEAKQKELSSSAFRRLCKAEYLNYLRVREWQDVYRQLRRLAKPLGLTVSEASVNPDGIHRSLLAGLLSHVGIKDPQKKDYVGARQARFVIFPGSTLVDKGAARKNPTSTKTAGAGPAALMSAELVQTSRLFARMNAAIDPAWAEPIAGDLCKHSYGEPHWEKNQGAAVAYERVTLYGVPIIPRRRIHYARVDAELARELFIQHGLVEGDRAPGLGRSRSDRATLPTARPADAGASSGTGGVGPAPTGLRSGGSHTRDLYDFDRANRRLLAELSEFQERTRRRDILSDDQAVFEFYDSRVPADVVSTRTFETWWRTARLESPQLLTMTEEALRHEDTPAIDEREFPAVWQQGDQRLVLSYRFEPGSEDDGVTVQVPLALLARLNPAGFDWQVPGLRHELVTAMIKALPKAIRRSVVPAADWAVRIMAELPDAPPVILGTATGAALGTAHPAPSFADTVALTIKRLTGAPATGDDVDVGRIPPHLLMTFRVVDDRGRAVASGKSLTELQRSLATQARESVAEASARAADPIERDELTTWDFDELPRFVDTELVGSRQAGRRLPGQPRNMVRGYPTLVETGNTVSIRVMATPEEQARALPGGVRRLLLNAIPSPVAYVQQHLTPAEKLALAASPYPTTKVLFDDCLAAVIDAALTRVKPDGQVFMRAEFETIRDRASGIVMDSMFETVSLVARTLAASRTVDKALSAATSMSLLPALTDARGQLAALVCPGFISATGLERLRHLPRYLAAIAWRVERVADNPGRDRVWMTEVQTATARFTDAGGRLPLPANASPALTHARWMLEELRVGLFAGHLGTAETVSLQRIRKVLA
ncbi:MAG: ATP-dependent RNA helicase HrpA [Microbacteriaceae bacterium]|nr:MAG: ATP-dependent RNA helicase HrpA [Microbacteriaceae bacterium]